MKKQFALLALSAATAAAFVSCQDDFDPTYRFNAHESEFMKAFGQPDPEQDWNMAVSTDIDINLGPRKAKSVKVYGNAGEADYYLLASIRNTSGAITVPVDISELTDQIVVTVDGDAYTGAPGSVIDCTGQTTSRAIIVDPANSGGDFTFKYPTPLGYVPDPQDPDNPLVPGDRDKITPDSAIHQYDQYRVVVSYPDEWEYFNAQQISALTATENWTKYLTMNPQAGGSHVFRTNPVSVNPDNLEDGAGILPESAVLNQYYRERTSNSFRYSFTIEVPVKPVYEPNSSYEGKLQPGEFMIFPYYYGTDKMHNMYMYYLNKYNEPVEWETVTLNNAGTTVTKRIPKLYPIFQDSKGDDLQIAPRPMEYIESIEGVAIYEYVRRDETEYSSYANIGRRIGEFRIGATDPVTGEVWDGETITLAPDQNVWVIPIVKRKNDDEVQVADGTYMDLTRFLESTTLPRMLQGYWTGSYFNPGKEGEPFYQRFPMTKRGLMHIKASDKDAEQKMQIRLQNYENGAYTEEGVERYVNLKIAANGLKVPETELEELQVVGFVRSNMSFFDIETNFFDIINDNNNGATTYSLAEMNLHTSMSAEDVDYRAKFCDDVVSAYCNSKLNDLYMASYSDEGFAITISIPDDPIQHWDDGVATPHPHRYKLTPEFETETKTVTQEIDGVETEVQVTQLKEGIINSGYFQLKLTFDLVTSEEWPRHEVNFASDPKSPARFNVYDENYVVDVILNKNNYTAADFKPVNTKYHAWRPYREESSSFYTELPMLCRTHGYKVRVYDKDGKPYSGRIGLALLNTYTANFDDGNTSAATKDKDWANFYTFSQRNLNRYQESGSTYEYDYAVAINHPVSGRQFFGFEDWEITHSAVGDIDINGKPSTRTYGNYDWNGHSGDYSSDRDYNDLIFRLEGAKLAEDPENRPIVLTDDTFPWIWALEDLGSTGDFDFNDVVVRISMYTFGEGEGADMKTKKEVIFSPMAAGGTLPIYLHIDLNNKAFGDNGHVLLAPTAKWATNKDGKYVLVPLGDGKFKGVDSNNDGIIDLTKGESFSNVPADAVEYHSWFAGSGYNDIPSGRPYGEMLNTGIDADVKARDIAVCRFIVEAKDFMVNNGSRNNDVALDAITEMFYVSVGSADVSNLLAIMDESIDQGRLETSDGSYLVWNRNKGRAAQSFIISRQHYEWSSEYTHIVDTYPQFPEWVKNKNNNTWFYKSNASEEPGVFYGKFSWPAFPTYDEKGNLNAQD